MGQQKKGVLKLDMIHSHGQDIFNGVLSINYGKGAKMGVRSAIWVNLTLKNKRKAIRQSCMA